MINAKRASLFEHPRLHVIKRGGLIVVKSYVERRTHSALRLFRRCSVDNDRTNRPNSFVRVVLVAIDPVKL